jgi:hypothetical protein
MVPAQKQGKNLGVVFSFFKFNHNADLNRTLNLVDY